MKRMEKGIRNEFGLLRSLPRNQFLIEATATLPVVTEN